MVLLPKGSSRLDPAPKPRIGSIVLYENNGIPLLGVITREDSKHFTLLNIRGSELQLPPIRLYLLPGSIPDDAARSEKITRLETLEREARELAPHVDLEQVWLAIQGESQEVETTGVCELFFGKNTVTEHLATRLALLTDRIYFKRNKESFSARNSETIEELHKQFAVEAEKGRRKKLLIECMRERLAGTDTALPDEVRDEIYLLAELAAGRVSDRAAKEARDLLKIMLDELQMTIFGTAEQKAFELLLRVGEFQPHTNLALIRYSPELSFSEAALTEAKSLNERLRAESEQLPLPDSLREDLTALPCFTIDDLTTQDMDDAVSLEVFEDRFRLGIHITDLGSILSRESVLDEVASRRATSIYCPDRTINMLPEALCHDGLSLIAGKRRRVISYLFEFDREYHLRSERITASWITIQQRLDYEEVDRILEQGHGAPTAPFNVAQALEHCYEITTRLEATRTENGATKYDRHDVTIIFEADGSVGLREFSESAPARALIGELMILANRASATALATKNCPAVFRAQPPSETDVAAIERNVPPGPALDFALRTSLAPSYTTLTPEPHTTLGLDAYLQITSPIRRYVDLINQRQLLHSIHPTFVGYSWDELDALRVPIDEILSVARVVSRESKRYWLLVYLQQLADRKENISGALVRRDPRMTLVELDQIYITVPAQVTAERKLSESVTLRITRVEPHWNVLKLEEIK